MFGWNDRRSVVESTTSENGVKLYKIGKWTVGIHPDGKVEYVATNGANTDPRQTFENVTIEDGELRIPISDMVGEVLKRCDPVDLAKALWTNDEVKDAFMESLVWTYNSTMDASDQVKFLHAVKEKVHNAAVGRLDYTLGKLDREVSRIAYHMLSAERMNIHNENVERMLNERFGVSDISLPRCTVPKVDGIDFDNYSGKTWTECRDYWRKKIEETFPGPDSPEEPKDDVL